MPLGLLAEADLGVALAALRRDPRRAISEDGVGRFVCARVRATV